MTPKPALSPVPIAALTLIPLGDDAALVCDGDVCAVPAASAPVASASAASDSATPTPAPAAPAS